MKQQQKQQTSKKTNSNSQQQEALMRFIQALAQVLQAQPEQVMQIAQTNPQALEQAIQAFQSTQDINQAAQAFAQASQQAAQKAAHGAKLNYVRKITNRCADDEETYFYKVGGKIGCGCKKKEQGGKVADDGKSIIARFKEKCGGKMKKHQQGGSLNGVPFIYEDPNQNGITYQQFQQMSNKEKNLRRNTIAKNYLSSPTLPNIGKAIYAYFGGYDPKNPSLQTGVPPDILYSAPEQLTRRVLRDLLIESKSGFMPHLSFYQQKDIWDLSQRFPKVFQKIQQRFSKNKYISDLLQGITLEGKNGIYSKTPPSGINLPANLPKNPTPGIDDYTGLPWFGD